MEPALPGVSGLTEDERKRLAERLTEDDQVDAAIKLAVRNAVRERKRLGLGIVVWEDGSVVHVPADRIPTGEEGPTC